MIQKRNFTKLVVCACAVFLTAGSLHAAGGMVIKNIQLKTGSTTVFSDACTSDVLNAEWKPQIGVSASSKGMVLNNQGKQRSEISRRVRTPSIGVTELTADVWLAPNEEQASWQKNQYGYARFLIASGSNRWNNLNFDINSNPKKTGYSAEISWQSNPSSGATIDNVRTWTEDPVISASKWVHIRVRMDPSNHIATLYIDNKETCNILYNPDNFKTIESLSISSGFGNSQ